MDHLQLTIKDLPALEAACKEALKYGRSYIEIKGTEMTLQYAVWLIKDMRKYKQNIN